jgi:hypothetical protein
MEIVLDVLLASVLPSSGIKRTGKWALSLVGLKAHAVVEALLGTIVWVSGLVGIVCAIAVVLYYRR